jgi:hypothetical protein
MQAWCAGAQERSVAQLTQAEIMTMQHLTTQREPAELTPPCASGACGAEQLRQLASEWVAPLQGAYYVASGVWPLLDDRSFQAVTGPKTDVWLVKTVGLLVAGIGAALLSEGRQPGRAATVVGVGSAAALAGIDIYYAGKRRISPIYLLDAVAEGVLLWGWAQRRRSVREPRATKEQPGDAGRNGE